VREIPDFPKPDLFRDLMPLHARILWAGVGVCASSPRVCWNAQPTLSLARIAGISSLGTALPRWWPALCPCASRQAARAVCGGSTTTGVRQRRLVDQHDALRRSPSGADHDDCLPRWHRPCLRPELVNWLWRAALRALVRPNWPAWRDAATCLCDSGRGLTVVLRPEND